MKTMNVQQDVPEMYTAILFTANADCENHLMQTAFAGEVLTAQADNADALTEAVKRASRLFLYIDTTTADSAAQDAMTDLFLHLWNNGLKEKRDHTFVALRTNAPAPVTRRLLGMDAGAGLYFFTLRRNSNVYMDSAAVALSSVPLRNISDTLQQTTGSASDGCTTQTILRHLMFYYERDETFDWKIPGKLYTGNAPEKQEIADRSVLAHAFITYTLYSAPGSTDRYISAEIRGGGYKMNIRTRDRGDGFVYPYWVHTGEAYTGNLLRKYRLTCELQGLDGGNVQIKERLPENVVKTSTVTETKSCSLSFSFDESGPSIGFEIGWSSSVSYTQGDFEMNNSFNIVGNTCKVIWDTIPTQWFHKNAFRDNDTRKELDVDAITYGSLAAGDGTVYRDLNSSDFPVGFHNMAPQAAALFYTTDKYVRIITACQIELQDSKQYWCAGVRHNAQHRWNIRGQEGEISHKDVLDLMFDDEVQITK